MITKFANQDRTLAMSSGLVVFIMLISMAAAAPSMPFIISGSADINDRPVPSGSVITAEVDGVVRGSVTLSDDGLWGQSGTSDKLLVQNAQNGDVIVFYVQTPQMSNRLQSAETAIFSSGDSEAVSLTFTGEEVPKPSGDDSDDSSGTGGNGGSGGSIPVADPEPVQIVSGAVLDLDLSGTEPYDIEVNNKDTVNVMIGGTGYPILVKSMSDFSVLLEFSGESIVLGIGETKELDLNGDYVTDIEITLTSIDDGSAFLTFTGLEKDVVEAGVEGVTGYVSANPMVPGIITIIIIAAIGGSALKLRRRGSL